MIRDEDAQLAGYVYVDTATRDIGGYVDAGARGGRSGVSSCRRATRCSGPGSTSSRSARASGCKILMPIVFFIIFMLLYMTFHSASEATIVMLSVVYAMTGGVILQWLLGYNFSVAVWIGYIALYGVAVQTGVVMVVYLHEALDKRLRAGWRADRARHSRGDDRRVSPAAPSEADDRQRRDGEPGADPVEHRRRLGRDEADCRADHRRHGDVDDSRADHYAGHLLHHESASARDGDPETLRDGDRGHNRGLPGADRSCEQQWFLMNVTIAFTPQRQRSPARNLRHQSVSLHV